MPLPTIRTRPGFGLGELGDADTLAVPVLPVGPADGDDGTAEDGAAPRPGPGAADVARAYGVDLAVVCRQGEITGAAGQVLTVPVAPPDGLPERLVLVGVGAGSAADLRRAGAAVARAVRGRASLVTTAAADAGAAEAAALAEGLLLASYTPPRTGIGKDPKPAVGEVVLAGVGGGGPDAAVRTATVEAEATWRVRDLANTPASTKNPQWVADRALDAAGERDGVTVEVLDEQQLADRGFGGLLAVGGGSASPPRLVTVTWTPPTRPRGHGRRIVLVGKGITYDTGGLSIKPREAMVPMKTDMAGAAVALAAVLACARLGVRHRVTALLPLAENAVSGSACRPGDVVTVWGGATVEIANTDAEGRMVLADALAFADATLDPDVLVDVATLTGAASLGLGRRHAALYTADDELAAGLERAAEATGERVWRMPLVEDYRPALESAVADLRHVPEDRKVGGGSITAALFLREFAGSRRWVHLDIAGPARADKDEHEVTKGASGFGARLLTRWLTTLPA